VRGATYSELAQGELAIFEAAREALPRYGREAIRHYIISHTETSATCSRCCCCRRRCGLMRGTLESGVDAANAA
jgi:phosphoenolpyruvate carboxylase